MTTREQNQPRPRGFASLDERRQKEIASRGGRAAHANGTAHKFSSEEARLAGRKGGETVSGNREHMAMIGRRGGEARHARRAASRVQSVPNEQNGGHAQGAGEEKKSSGLH
ncbi:MAG TPA: general stress protein [Rudaea sp.]|nr:general stress protein [Rudaea sp.]